MKKVSHRALFALALAAVLAVGTLAFCVKYAANAENDYMDEIGPKLQELQLVLL